MQKVAYWTVFVTLIITYLGAKEQVELYRPTVKQYRTITLEHATTPEAIKWGLMQRRALPWNRGMTFSYEEEGQISVWMFNMFLNLDVAFLDHNKVIRAIHLLEAHPDKMDPKRPVLTPDDFRRYPEKDPIILYFQNRSVSSSHRTKYALEMNEKWFEKNDVRVGDVVLFSPDKETGYILYTFDIEPYLPKTAELSLLQFPKDAPYSVWLPYGGTDYDLAFLDKGSRVVVMGTLPAAGPYLEAVKPVMYSPYSASSLLIAPKGWLKKNSIQVGSEIKFNE